jgi:ribosome maturation factor RimP
LLIYIWKVAVVQAAFFTNKAVYGISMDKAKLEAEIENTLDGSGFELVDIKVASHNGKPLIQVFADREAGGITLDDCTALSEKVGECLDTNNFYENGYFLEVSSPGIDRIIKKEKDFKRFMGKHVKVRLKRPVNNSRVYYGDITGFENGQVLLSGDLKFSLEDIDEARLNLADDEILKGK